MRFDIYSSKLHIASNVNTIAQYLFIDASLKLSVVKWTTYAVYTT